MTIVNFAIRSKRASFSANSESWNEASGMPVRFCKLFPIFNLDGALSIRGPLMLAVCGAAAASALHGDIADAGPVYARELDAIAAKWTSILSGAHLATWETAELILAGYSRLRERMVAWLFIRANGRPFVVTELMPDNQIFSPNDLDEPMTLDIISSGAMRELGRRQRAMHPEPESACGGELLFLSLQPHRMTAVTLWDLDKDHHMGIV